MPISVDNQMNYKITEQYSRGEENPIAARGELNDARLFVTKKSTIDDSIDLMAVCYQ